MAASATPKKKIVTAPSAKKVAKIAAKPVTRAVAPAKKKPSVAAAAPKPKTVKPIKAAKPKKTKLVRDSMTIPKDEYAVLDVLKARATKLTQPAKKTELLRAGIKALAAMGDGPFLAALRAVPSLKTGRPSKSN